MSILIGNPDMRKECDSCFSTEDVKDIAIKNERFRSSYSRSIFLCKTCRLELAKKLLEEEG